MSGSQSIVAFAEVPASIRVPGTYVEVRPSYRNTGVGEWPARALMVGQGTSAGGAVANQAYQITRPDQADGLFGAGSILAAMCRAFLAANRFTPLWAVRAADPAGSAATGTRTFTGTPTQSGQVAAYIGGERVSIPVVPTDTATTLGVKLRDAVNARTDLPVTATASSGTVTLTFRHTGLVGNELPLAWQLAADDLTPAGLTLGGAAMSGGTGQVDLAPVIAAIANDWFTDVALAWSDTTSLGLAEVELTRRYAADGELDAHAYVARGGSFGQLSSYGAARNSPHVTCLGMAGMQAAPWRVAAALAGVCAFQLTNDPARQLRGLALPGVRAPQPAARFIDTERDLLLRDGISTFNVLADGTVVLERVVTMYQVTNLGVADTAWLDIMVPKTLSRIRHDWREWTQRAYPRHKLADDGALAAAFSDVVVTPRILAAAWAGRSALYERLGWVEGAAETAARSVFVRDGTDRNRVNSRQEVRIIGNLMVLAAALEFEV